MGKRLGELTRENTKCMVKLREQTLIERMIRQLADSGIVQNFGITTIERLYNL